MIRQEGQGKSTGSASLRKKRVVTCKKKLFQSGVIRRGQLFCLRYFSKQAIL